MVGSSRWVVGIAVVALSNVACELGHSCTDIGCVSSADVSVTSKSGLWQEGNYVLELTLDGQPTACSFAIPSDLPPPGSASPVDCDRSVSGELLWGSSATNVVELRLRLPSEPKTVKVDLSLYDTLILSETQQMIYSENQPNAGCEPICRNGTADFTID